MKYFLFSVQYDSWFFLRIKKVTKNLTFTGIKLCIKVMTRVCYLIFQKFVAHV